MTFRGSLGRFAVFVIASVALTWWLAGQITGRGPSGSIELTARFGDVSGLVEGDDVRLGGLPVGRVQKVEVVDGDAVVAFTVDDDVEVPADSTIAVRWRNLIGQRYLGLRPGEARDRLADGDEIDRADDVVDLGRIVNQLSPLAQAVGPDQVNRIMESLVIAFEGNETAFDDLTADLASLAGALNERTILLGQMQEDYATIGEAIASRDRQIADMVTNLTSISGTLDATDRLVARALVSDVLTTGIEDGRVRALVFVDIDARGPEGEQRLQNLSFVLDLEAVDGVWLVDAVSPLPIPEVVGDGVPTTTTSPGATTTAPAPADTAEGPTPAPAG